MIISELFADTDWAEKIVLNSYENLTQFLENFALIQRVFHSKDRNLVLKAMSYSYNHLESFISTLHLYPVNLRNT
jgi:hypothetical protein